MNFVIKSRLVQDQTWFLFAKKTSLLRMLLLIKIVWTILPLTDLHLFLNILSDQMFLKKLFDIFDELSIKFELKFFWLQLALGCFRGPPRHLRGKKKNIYIYILNCLELVDMLNYTESIVKWVISLLRLYSMNKCY